MTPETNSTIDNAAKVLQSLPPLQRALLGREQLIIGQVLGREIGPREHRLLRMLYWSGRPGMLVISLLLLFSRVWAQRHVPVSLPLPQALFIGIDALHEKNLRQDLRDRLGHDHVFVDQRQMDHFALTGRLRLSSALKEWARLVPLSIECSRSMADEYDTRELHATLAMRLPDLAHLLTQFRALHAADNEILIACSTAELPAHAACVVGFSVEYHQHGFLSRSLVFPDFAAMNALTKVEGAHVASRVPGLLVNCTSVDIQKCSRERVLAIASIYGEFDILPVIALVCLALNEKYQVVIRPHPRGEDSVWRDLKKMDGVAIDADGDFDAFLTKWQPAFLATWFSTTLLDGLLAGAMPVSLSAARPNLVFPLDQISLPFPQASTRLERCLTDEVYRLETIQGFTEVIS